ncbi:hypothetical protein HDU87_004326 [Geranomyces variabilis]|uniref:F-box domain-containing protein n=1 Tax=Geranomyces variabilis TaxID=109894 RepID=A0AAD5TP74_9FUNG|nr:hypothetical protein HDU87_004326 [Geranomyces variabilis]
MASSSLQQHQQQLQQQHHHHGRNHNHPPHRPASASASSSSSSSASSLSLPAAAAAAAATASSSSSSSSSSSPSSSSTLHHNHLPGPPPPSHRLAPHKIASLTMPRSKSLIIDAASSGSSSASSAASVLTSPFSYEHCCSSPSPSAPHSASVSIPNPQNVVTFPPMPMPMPPSQSQQQQQQQHNLLHSALNLDTPHATRVGESFDDPADSRIHSCSHMFLTDTLSTNNACPSVSGSPPTASFESGNKPASALNQHLSQQQQQQQQPHHPIRIPLPYGTTPSLDAQGTYPSSMPMDTGCLLYSRRTVIVDHIPGRCSDAGQQQQQGSTTATATTTTTRRSSLMLVAPAVEREYVPMDEDVMEIMLDPTFTESAPPARTPFSARNTSVVAHFPPELLVQIFSHFDPPSRDSSTAFLSPSCTIAALRHCASVCRWWNHVATRVLWRRPRVYDAARFEKLVVVAENAASAAAAHLAKSENTSTTTFAYPDLIQHLSLSQTLSEPHRYAHRLSPLLVRLISLPTLHLATLDLGFCKGVSNFALQRCAHALRSLTSLNLAGGGRSEICVIKLASECRDLKRLGLGWNSAVTDFCVREVGRWCPNLEWIDLSGCYGVGDTGVMWLVKGLVGTSSRGGGASNGLKRPARLMDVGTIPTNAPSPTLSSSPGTPPNRFLSSSPSAANRFLDLPLPPCRSPTNVRSSLPTTTTTMTTTPTAASACPPLLLASAHHQRRRTRMSALKHINLSYCTHITTLSVRDLVERCGDSLEIVNIVGCGDTTAVRSECAWVAAGVLRQRQRQQQNYQRRMIQSPPPQPPVVTTVAAARSSGAAAAGGGGPIKYDRLDGGRFSRGVPDGRMIKINVPGFVPFWDGIRG